MHLERWYYVYIVTNRSKTLYTGIAGSLRKRLYEHKTGLFDGFTKRYKIDRLVYYERFRYVNNAIAREKQIKRWTKIKKILLIVSMNPAWRDLAEDWFPDLGKRMHRSFDSPFFSRAAGSVRLAQDDKGSWIARSGARCRVTKTR